MVIFSRVRHPFGVHDGRSRQLQTDWLAINRLVVFANRVGDFVECLLPVQGMGDTWLSGFLV